MDASEVSVYIPEIVQEIRSFYGRLLDLSHFDGKLFAHLNQLAERLYEGLQNGHEGALTELNNYNPQLLGIPIAELKERAFNLSIAQQTIASEYGFANWQDLIVQDPDYDPRFEEAVYFLLSGNIRALRESITKYPELLKARSPYGHGATLLHYVSNNGLEIWRQVVPANLPDIAQYLIDSGADKNATMAVYGGHHTAYFLAASSAHPYDAGIAEALRSVLR